MKKQLLLLFALVFMSTVLCAQDSETDAVKRTITTMFDGMRKGDSTLVKSAFSANVIFQDISLRNGAAQVQTEDAKSFLKAVGTPHSQVWDERITFVQVLIDDKLASVWANYKFYLGGTFSHCGVDSFQLAKEKDGWKIIYLIDTRRKDNCKE